MIGQTIPSSQAAVSKVSRRTPGVRRAPLSRRASWDERQGVCIAANKQRFWFTEV